LRKPWLSSWILSSQKLFTPLNNLSHSIPALQCHSAAENHRDSGERATFYRRECFNMLALVLWVPNYVPLLSSFFAFFYPKIAHHSVRPRRGPCSSARVSFGTRFV
jgi:hypothetical protein